MPLRKLVLFQEFRPSRSSSYALASLFHLSSSSSSFSLPLSLLAFLFLVLHFKFFLFISHPLLLIRYHSVLHPLHIFFSVVLLLSPSRSLFLFPHLLPLCTFVVAVTTARFVTRTCVRGQASFPITLLDPVLLIDFRINHKGRRTLRTNSQKIPSQWIIYSDIPTKSAYMSAHVRIAHVTLT